MNCLRSIPRLPYSALARHTTHSTLVTCQITRTVQIRCITKKRIFRSNKVFVKNLQKEKEEKRALKTKEEREESTPKIVQEPEKETKAETTNNTDLTSDNTQYEITKVELIRGGNASGYAKISSTAHGLNKKDDDEVRYYGRNVQVEIRKLIGPYTYTSDAAHSDLHFKLNTFFKVRRDRLKNDIKGNNSSIVSVLLALDKTKHYKAMDILYEKVIKPENLLTSSACALLYPVVSLAQAKEIFETICEIEGHGVTYHHAHLFMTSILRFAKSEPKLKRELDEAVERLAVSKLWPTGLTYAIYIHYHLLVNQEEEAKAVFLLAQEKNFMVKSATFEKVKSEFLLRQSDTNIDWTTPFLEQKTFFVDSVTLHNEVTLGLTASNRFYKEKAAELTLHYKFKDAEIVADIAQDFRVINKTNYIRLVMLIPLQEVPVRLEVNSEGVPSKPILHDWIKRAKIHYESDIAGFTTKAREFAQKNNEEDDTI